MDIKYYVSPYLNGDTSVSPTDIDNKEKMLNIKFPSGDLENNKVWSYILE